MENKVTWAAENPRHGCNHRDERLQLWSPKCYTHNSGFMLSSLKPWINTVWFQRENCLVNLLLLMLTALCGPMPNNRHRLICFIPAMFSCLRKGMKTFHKLHPEVLSFYSYPVKEISKSNRILKLLNYLNFELFFKGGIPALYALLIFTSILSTER